MLLVKLAWRNIWRHTRRTLITAMAMSIGVALMMAMLAVTEGMFDTMFDALVVKATGHVQVHHEDFPKKRALYATVDNFEDVEAKIRAVDGFVGLSARVYGYGLLAAGDEAAGGQLTGIVPSDEAQMNALHRRVNSGRFLGEEAAGEIVLGVDLAKKLKAKLGTELVAVTSAADGSMGNELFTLVGTLKTGSQAIDKNGAYLHRDDVQELLSLDGRVHEIAVLGGERETLPGFTQAVKSAAQAKGLVVRDWGEINPFALQIMQSQDMSVGIFVFIIFAVAGLGVLNTMLMSVFERTRELGVSIALGLKPRQVMSLVLLESVFLTLIAIGIGLVLGAGLDYYVIEYGIPMGDKEIAFSGFIMEPLLRGKFVVDNVVTAVSVVFFVSLLSALYPAWRAARLRPVVAMGEH